MIQQRTYLSTGRLQSARGVMIAKLKAAIGEAVLVKSATGESIHAEVIGFQDDQVLIMPFSNVTNLQQNALVVAKKQPMTLRVGNGLLGRVLDSIGEPMDQSGPLDWEDEIAIDFDSPDPLSRQLIQEPFVTGIRAIDGILTMGKGQRVGLFAGSGVGKSTLLGEIAKYAESDVNVVALIGERGREVLPFIQQALGPDGMKRSVLVVSTSDQTALSRVRAAETAIAIANWFRSRNANVLLMLDSLTRMSHAQREIGLLLGEPPTSRGYTPSVFQKMSFLLEQLGTSDRGSITGILTVLVDGDDMNEPIADAARSILDGHIVMNRKLAQQSHFPAIDISASASRVFNEITQQEHRLGALHIRRMMALYQQVEDLIQIGAYQPGAMPETDLAVRSMESINQFLSQSLGEVSAFNETVGKIKALCDAPRIENSLAGKATP